MDAQAFEAGLRQDGYDEILTRDAQPGSGLDEHTHDWDVRAMVLNGEFFVQCADGRTVCRPGDTFELAAGVEHSEGAGPEGATLLIGRRHKAA